MKMEIKSILIVFSTEFQKITEPHQKEYFKNISKNFIFEFC